MDVYYLFGLRQSSWKRQLSSGLCQASVEPHSRFLFRHSLKLRQLWLSSSTGCRHRYLTMLQTRHVYKDWDITQTHAYRYLLYTIKKVVRYLRSERSRTPQQWCPFLRREPPSWNRSSITIFWRWANRSNFGMLNRLGLVVMHCVFEGRPVC